MITVSMIERDFPHRIEADPDICPVCCGDTQTDWRKYGTEKTHTIDVGTSSARDIYRCGACEVWNDRKRNTEDAAPVADALGKVGTFAILAVRSVHAENGVISNGLPTFYVQAASLQEARIKGLSVTLDGTINSVVSLHVEPI